VSAAVLPEDCDGRIRRLLEYWESVRPVGGGLPGRQHIDPVAIPELLPWLWMLDVERDPRFLASLTYPDYVAAAERHALRFHRGPPVFHINKDYVSIERLLLPLASDGKEVDKLLALTVYFRQAAGKGA
jgi:hypothetical protein